MDLKLRLQRVLQIIEDTERVGAMSDLERDIVLGELREAYMSVKFGVAESAAEPIASASLQQEPDSEVDSEEDNEPEVEFEIIFNEEEDEEEDEEGSDAPVDLSQLFEAVGLTHKTSGEDEEDEVESGELKVESGIEAPTAAETPAVAPAAIGEVAAADVAAAVETPNTLNTLNAPASPAPTPKRSPLLSLYEDDAPVLGEQFRETPSVADVIACPKGVAESTPVTSLREAIGVADRYMFIRELFDGDDEAYEAAITALDAQQSFDDCVIYISENYVWRAQSDAAKSIMSLLKRKFNE